MSPSILNLIVVTLALPYAGEAITAVSYLENRFATRSPDDIRILSQDS